MASPFFFVGKKETKELRPCQDYQYLNEGTIKNAYPLPLISDLIDKLKGATIFTKIDLRKGYNNIRIKEGDKWKGAFKTNKGLFKPLVMFFGMCNSPTTFQAMMNDILSDFLTKGWVVVYMDDILIFSKDQQEHQDRTRRLVQRLKDNDLYAKWEKSCFDVREVEFLGLVIHPDEVAMDPAKLNRIRDWPEPKTLKQVQSFLGFGNFYQKFIANYSSIARPLHRLTNKGVPFNWDTDCQTAFNTMKRKFIKAPVLLMPDSTKQFLLECDASLTACRAVLRQ